MDKTRGNLCLRTFFAALFRVDHYVERDGVEAIQDLTHSPSEGCVTSSCHPHQLQDGDEDKTAG